MNPKSASREAKLAYLAGLYAGVITNKSRLGKKRLDELKKHAVTGSECTFGFGTFRGPLVVWKAEIYFDSLFEELAMAMPGG